MNLLQNRSTIIHRKIIGLLDKEQVKMMELRHELRGIKGGKLYIRCRNGNVYFTEYTSDGEKGICRDKDKVYGLARKKYIQSVLSQMEADCKILKQASSNLQKIQPQIWNDFHNLDIDKVRLSPKEYFWITNPKETNTYMPSALRYATKAGVKMRSKSERTIGNRLEERGVLYRYEIRFDFEGGFFYPDFTILRQDGTVIIWEHFGLMDKPEYYLKACEKIRRYRQAGFCQHTNLICTWEEDLEDMSTIDEIIDKFIFN